MPIPVLNENQMTALKGVLNGGKTIDLTGGGAKNTRLPNMPEEGNTTINVGSSYTGPFAVVSKGITVITSDGSSYNAVQVHVSSGAISVDEWRLYSPSYGDEHTFYALQNDYDLYMEILTPHGDLLPIASSFPSVSGTRFAYVSIPHTTRPDHLEGIQRIKLAENRGGKIFQIQHGEISDVPWLYTPDYASSAGIAKYALSAGYRGPFHVEIASIEVNVSEGGLQGTLNIFDNTDSDANISYRPSAGHIVQGGTHTVIDGGYEIPFSSPEIGTKTADLNVYLYEDSDGYKYSAVVQGDTCEFEGFFTRLAFIQGGVQLRQTQYGDIVDVDVGGSTVINSSSIYSSTIVHSSSITSDIHTSTVYSSSIYSSTIVNSSTIINSSSFALEYKGHFCVSGAIESAGTPQEAFIATVYDGTNPNGNVAGEIIVGNTVSIAGKSSFPCPIGSSVYLIGTVNGNSVSVEYSACGAAPSVQGNQFYTQLACNSGGTMTQMQYGDIVQPVKDDGGGGGGNDDSVIIYQEEHTESGQITAQTNKEYYIALFGSLIQDTESYEYICQYYITYDRSTTPYTIVRHKTDYNDLDSYFEGDGYSFELVLPTPNEDCFVDICLFAFSTILISSAKPIYNYQGAPCAQPYMISNRNVKLVYIANDNGGRWYIYGN